MVRNNIIFHLQCNICNPFTTISFLLIYHKLLVFIELPFINFSIDLSQNLTPEPCLTKTLSDIIKSQLQQSLNPKVSIELCTGLWERRRRKVSKLCLKLDAHAVCLFLSRSFGPVIGAFYSPRDSCVVIVRRVVRRRSAIRNGTATTDRTNEPSLRRPIDR